MIPSVAPAIRCGARRHLVGLAVALTLLHAGVVAAATGTPGLVVPSLETGNAKFGSVPVPDPSDLRASSWDYLALTQPGLEQRITTLLNRATESAAKVPPDRASEAGQALERLRISLSALPAMLAAEPAPLPKAPAVTQTYTTSEFLELNRSIRALQDELDERHSALTLFTRALNEDQRQLDTTVATYLAGRDSDADRTIAGLGIMARWAEIAITGAEQRLRQAEADAIQARIIELRARQKQRGIQFVLDEARTPLQLGVLIETNQRKLEEQREKTLRLRAERSSKGREVDVDPAKTEVADLRILTAMIEESLLASRIALLGTERDWLSISAGHLDTNAIAELEQRITARRADLDTLDDNIDEWTAEIQRVMASALRTPSAELTAEAAQLRATRLNLAQEAVPRIVGLRSLIADVRFGSNVAYRLLRQSAGWRGWFWTDIVIPGSELVERVDRWLGASLFRIGGTPVTAYGLLRIVIFILAALVVSRIVQRVIARFGAREFGRPSAGLYTVSRLSQYFLVTAALIIGLSAIGLDFSQLALVAGALSIGIGFGLQSVVNNFVSGLMILFERNLKVGDVVELDSGVRGVVREINVRSTLISTNDSVNIVVPNSEFIAGKVTNYTLREPYHRIHVPFTVAYGTDKDEVRRVVIEAACNVAFTHQRADREPDVWLVKFSDNGLDFELVVWINPAAVTRPRAVLATYLWEIETALRRHGIQIPFPQRDIRVQISPNEASQLDASTKPSA